MFSHNFSIKGHHLNVFLSSIEVIFWNLMNNEIKTHYKIVTALLKNERYSLICEG